MSHPYRYAFCAVVEGDLPFEEVRARLYALKNLPDHEVHVRTCYEIDVQFDTVVELPVLRSPVL